MAQALARRWKLTGIAKNAGVAHRLRATAAAGGNGNDASVRGTVALDSGPAWTHFLEWNDRAGSDWRGSAVLRADGFANPIIRTAGLRADDNFESERDNDSDDLTVLAQNHDPAF
jgi:hypothetical protein